MDTYSIINTEDGHQIVARHGQRAGAVGETFSQSQHTVCNAVLLLSDWSLCHAIPAVAPVRSSNNFVHFTLCITLFLYIYIFVQLVEDGCKYSPFDIILKCRFQHPRDLKWRFVSGTPSIFDEKVFITHS